MELERGRSRSRTRNLRSRSRSRSRSQSVRRRYTGSLSTKIGDETKYVDGFRNAAALSEKSLTTDGTWADTETDPSDEAGVIGCLPVPSVGNSYSQRNGRKIKLKTIRIKGSLIWKSILISTGATDITGRGMVRIVIVKDCRTNKAQLSGEDVIGPGLGQTGGTMVSGDGGTLNLPSKPEGWGRFKILKDMYFRCPTTPLTFDSGNNRVVEQGYVTPFHITIHPNCVVNMESSGGTVANVIDNSFHMLACTVTGTDVEMSYYARTVFEG